MRRYFFHQHRSHDVIADAEGSEYATLEDAIGEAAQAARDIMADRLRSGATLGVSEFRIADAQGQILAVVTFNDVAHGLPIPQRPAEFDSQYAMQSE